MRFIEASGRRGRQETRGRGEEIIRKGEEFRVRRRGDSQVRRVIPARDRSATEEYKKGEGTSITNSIGGSGSRRRAWGWKRSARQSGGSTQTWVRSLLHQGTASHHRRVLQYGSGRRVLSHGESRPDEVVQQRHALKH